MRNTWLVPAWAPKKRNLFIPYNNIVYMVYNKYLTLNINTFIDYAKEN